MKIYGIIGHPIKHTLSPAMHNAAFAAVGIDAAYVPFEVRPQDLKSAVKNLISLGISGFNVTIPHKTSCMELLDKTDESARLIGAVNTINVKKGKLTGYNTDGRGFLRSLKDDLDITPNGKNVFIVGAGGAARAVVCVLLLNGAASVTIVDRIKEKAVELVNSYPARISVKSIDYKQDWAPHIKNADLLINASPVGMKDSDPSPVNINLLHRDLSVFDLIYNKHTRLVKAAKAKGLRACGGFGMLLYQGVFAFEIWTGKKAPVAIMRNALIAQLSLRGPRNARWWT
jgi:shikimate dehydrogenase